MSADILTSIPLTSLPRISQGKVRFVVSSCSPASLHTM
jgi:hypothetical protein